MLHNYSRPKVSFLIPVSMNNWSHASKRIHDFGLNRNVKLRTNIMLVPPLQFQVESQVIVFVNVGVRICEHSCKNVILFWWLFLEFCVLETAQVKAQT